MVQTVKFSNGSFQNESGKQDFTGAIQSLVVRNQFKKRQKKCPPFDGHFLIYQYDDISGSMGEAGKLQLSYRI